LKLTIEQFCFKFGCYVRIILQYNNDSYDWLELVDFTPDNYLSAKTCFGTLAFVNRKSETRKMFCQYINHVECSKWW